MRGGESVTLGWGRQRSPCRFALCQAQQRLREGFKKAGYRRNEAHRQRSRCLPQERSEPS